VNRLISHGSYILIIPIEVDDGENVIEGVCKGKIYSNIMKHQLSMDQIVYYLEKDITKIVFKGRGLHAILHYHILFKEVEVAEEKKPEQVFEFEGMTI